MVQETQKVFLTPQGLENLKKELEELKKKRLPQLIKRVARARDFGDLSENAEYSSAREDLSFVEGKIAELERILANATVITPKNNSKNQTKVVSLGCKVTVEVNGQRHIFTLVGEWEADPINKKISHSSPLGKALLGKKKGDKVEVEAPAGKLTYKILEIA